MGPHSLNDLIYSGPKASYLGPFLLSLVVEPTMALYTGSDILANRGSPHFGAESPDGRLGPLMAPCQDGRGRSRRQAGKAIIKILEYARKIPKILMGWEIFNQC